MFSDGQGNAYEEGEDVTGMLKISFLWQRCHLGRYWEDTHLYALLKKES